MFEKGDKDFASELSQDEPESLLHFLHKIEAFNFPPKAFGMICSSEEFLFVSGVWQR